MPRSVNSVASRARRKKMFKLTKGFWGSRGNVLTVAKNTLEKGLGYAYRDRKTKKRNIRGLWIQRINAGVRAYGMSYSTFMGKCHAGNIGLSRKVLADLAMNNTEAFKAIVDQVKDLAPARASDSTYTGKVTPMIPLTKEAKPLNKIEAKVKNAPVPIAAPKAKSAPKAKPVEPIVAPIEVAPEPPAEAVAIETPVVDEVVVETPVVETPIAEMPVESGAKDDLKKMEGIGPAIEKLLNAAGINTWAALASTEVSKLEEILEAAGSRFASHKPGTWPRQAALAAAGKWDELKTWQDTLDGGKE